MAEHGGNPLPDATLESIRRNGVALKGPITTPVGEGFRSRERRAAQGLDLYAQVRPCKTYPGVRTRYRTSTSSSSARTPRTSTPASSSSRAQPDAEELIAWLEPHGTAAAAATRASRSSRSRSPARGGSSNSPSNTPARIGRRKVTAVHKANIMKFTDGLFLAARALSRPSIRTSSSTTASSTTCACSSCSGPRSTTCWCCRTSTATSSPTSCAGLIGGLGVAPGANFGDDVAVFEPTHGSRAEVRRPEQGQPDRPMILSGMLMLRPPGRARCRRPAGAGHRRANSPRARA